jgi:hypothetical protein
VCVPLYLCLKELNCKKDIGKKKKKHESKKEKHEAEDKNNKKTEP